MAIRIGVIGAGNNTRVRHIPGLRAIDGVEVVSVCNRSRESSQRVADAMTIPQVYGDWRELIAANDIDAVVIGTWPYMHCEMTCAALQAGKHVMCEARMAMNPEEARTMLATARAHPELVAQIVPSPFTLRIDRTIQDLLADGYLGDLYAMTVRGTVPGFVNTEAPLTWRQRQDRSGLNILNMGIWYEAMIRWVGPAARVMANTKVNVKQRRDEDGNSVPVTVPDHVDILADLASGAQANMRFSAVAGFGSGNEVWIYGSEGTLRLDSALNVYGGRRGDSAMAELENPPEGQGYWRVEEEFCNAIRGQERITRTPFDVGVHYMEFTEAVTRSSQTRQVVSLPL